MRTTPAHVAVVWLFLLGSAQAAPTLTRPAVLFEPHSPQALPEHPEVLAWTPRVGGRVWSAELGQTADVERIAQEIGAAPSVRWAEPDVWLSLQPSGAPLNDTEWERLWHLDNRGQLDGTPGVDLGALGAWAWSTGEGVKVAIIDDGVEENHPDLSVVAGFDPVTGESSSEPFPGSGHGTSMAGMAAAIGDNGLGVAGVAHQADLIGVRLLGQKVALSHIYDAFLWAADEGAVVLSNSWSLGEQWCEPIPAYQSLQSALFYVTEQARGGLGAAVVYSAGNGGCDNSGVEYLHMDGLTVVAASTDRDRNSSYSNYGSPLWITSPSSPGSRDGAQVWSTDRVGEEGYGDGDYATTGGTSSAAAAISGVYALMFAANDRLRASEARQVLCETATRIDLENGAWQGDWSPIYGCGRADAEAAVAAVAATAPAAPQLVWPTDGDAVRAFEGDEGPGVSQLLWEPAIDPDGDVRSYRVDVWDVEDALERSPRWSYEVEQTTLTLDLSAMGRSPGDGVRWQVVPIDDWGEGSASEAWSFTLRAGLGAVPEVEFPEPEPSGCTCQHGRPGRSHPWLWGLAALTMAFWHTGRRRTPARSEGTSWRAVI